jgi:hypothetical protein
MAEVFVRSGISPEKSPRLTDSVPRGRCATLPFLSPPSRKGHMNRAAGTPFQILPVLCYKGREEIFQIEVSS